jgi:hypothetical protein
METKFYVFICWLSLSLIGLFLVSMRNDADKLQSEAHFIMTKGTLIHKLTYITIAFVLLPFTIPYSLKHFFKKK